MTELLLKKFTRKNDRNSIIFLSGIMGIIFNLILFIIKIIAGAVMGSVAVISDAINSFSDIGSSAVTVISSKASSVKPDKDHPFGHGRMEYVLTLLVSAIIFVAGIELLKESVKKIFNHEEISFSWVIIALLILSILIKLYMFSFTKVFAEKSASDLLLSVAKDYLSDLISTGVVIISALLYNFFKLNIDGWIGAFVSVLVMITGVKSLLGGVKKLLGSVPPEEVYQQVKSIILESALIQGVHDIVLHDYGPDKFIGTAHAEVFSNSDIVEVHEELDSIERKIFSQLGISMVMHVDPVVCDDEETIYAKNVLDDILKDFTGLSYHDFRIKSCSTNNELALVFDLVVPYKMTEIEQKNTTDEIIRRLKQVNENYNPIIDVDME